ncbi:MAG: YcxB family protein [Clostridia bacterium]|nr:YcxB family protein [Clostridia bacterium]
MVEFKIKFDKRIGNKIAEVQYENTLKKIKKLKIFFLVLGALLIAYPIINLFKDLFDYYVFGIGVFSFVFWLVFPKIVKKNLYKQQNKISEEGLLINDVTEEVYKFDLDKVYIFTTMGEKYRAAIETDYDYFSLVTEDDECYILYISSVQCHLIFKDSLTKGTLDEFNRYLKLHFTEDKYIRKIEEEKKEN